MKSRLCVSLFVFFSILTANAALAARDPEMDHASAKEYCANKSRRLPTRAELTALYNAGKLNKEQHYWSSEFVRITVDTFDTDAAYEIDGYDGLINYDYVKHKMGYAVRCI